MAFICPICGNKDPRKIGYINGQPYCRNCISFKGEEADFHEHFPKKANYQLNYSLSKDQLKISDKLILNYKKGINTLVHAVCGSGKTEIVLEVIRYAIECGDRVGFAVPRRDVAIELYERFNDVFKRNTVVLVYGGHTDELNGDLICLTTHQLYRYDKWFDLLILDEVDAFPFKNNGVLNAFFERSVRGKYILLSATPDENLIKKLNTNGDDIERLYSRFHGHPLPVPKLVIAKSIFKYPTLIREVHKILKVNKQIFIFAPTITIAKQIFMILKLLFKDGNIVHSKKEDRSQIIEDFKKKKYRYLVTTAVLERGVTVKNLQVIIFESDHEIYDQYSLVQIAGRVGRKKDAPDGKVIFIAEKETEDIQKAINNIKEANKNL